MSTSNDSSLRATQAALQWLTTHAGFPARRLPAKAEVLVLLFAVATEENRAAASRQRPTFGTANGPSTKAYMRDYTIRRRHAHVKCDNSAKV